MPDPRDEAKMPPIPDGGLSESMPDWLRRPPAWRTLEDADVVQTRPAVADRLPEPDTSVIDPRTFLIDDDLPLWLRNMGRGLRTRRELPGDDDAVEVEARLDEATGENGEATSVPTHTTAPRSASQPASRFVPRAPTVIAPPRAAAPMERVGQVTQGYLREPSPWWQGAPMVLLLSALLLAAVVVIAFLAFY